MPTDSFILPRYLILNRVLNFIFISSSMNPSFPAKQPVIDVKNNDANQRGIFNISKDKFRGHRLRIDVIGYMINGSFHSTNKKIFKSIKTFQEPAYKLKPAWIAKTGISINIYSSKYLLGISVTMFI